jgi:hypothetical protein
MDFKKTIEEYLIFCNKKGLCCYGGNSIGSVCRSLLDDFCELLTGFKNGIDIKTDWSHDDSGYRFKYHLPNGDEYQYNYFNLDKNFNLVSVDGDGERQIRKIFDFINYWKYDDFLKWREASRIAAHIAYYQKCDEEKKQINRGSFYQSDLYIQLDDKTLKKYDKLNFIHQNILMKPNDEIKRILELMLPVWEPDRFKCGGFLSQTTHGSFSNDAVPDIKLDDNKIIIFPEDGRGSICNEFLVTYDMDKILKMPIGKTIVLRNKRKGSKQKTYKVVEHKAKFATALKELKTGKIEFITNEGLAEDCYDALFSSNKMIYRGWFNKRVLLINKKLKKHVKKS